MLKGSYGDIRLKISALGSFLNCRDPNSVWWSDLLLLFNNFQVDHFISNCGFIVGNGFFTTFWHVKCCEDNLFRDCFLVLLSASALQEVSVVEMWGGVTVFGIGGI